MSGFRVLTASQMRACDSAAIEAGTPSVELMRRAAQALAGTVRREAGQLPVVFFCGSGNNGGDGFAAAELLAGYSASKRSEDETAPFDGLAPFVLFSGDRERMSPDCAHYLARAERAGVRIFTDPGDLPEHFLGVDCLFGTGFHGEIPETLAGVFAALKSAERVVACDVPSGLDADTGRADPKCVPAAATVTFAAFKFGHFLADGRDFCGNLELADIGIPIVTESASLLSEEDLAPLFAPRRKNCHKGSFERVFLVGGSAEYPGSVNLSAAAEAALRSGCGYATAVLPERAGTVTCLESTRKFCGTEHLVFDEALFSEIAERASAVVAGMGMGQSEDCGAIVGFLLEKTRGVLVLDADALNLLARRPDLLEGPRAGRVCLTPHPGEFARLCGRTTAEIAKDPTGIADAFASKFGVSLLLKGASTYVTDGRNRYLAASGSPALAKAGSGDALDGFLGVTVPRAEALGLGTAFGLAAGSFLHGLCGTLAAQTLTEHAVLAGDLPKFLPEALKIIQRV